jgi:serine/threonine protein kinase
MSFDITGQSFEHYRIIEPLGEGGMAVVYKAYDTRLNRNVAIKVVRTERITHENLIGTRQRFEREASALSKLTHPNIVPIIDYGEHQGSPFLVMPFIRGGTLKRFAGHPIPWNNAVRLVLPIARALAYAHQNNIIHRDVKPSNILLTESGEPLLSDFGIAKILEENDLYTLTNPGIGVGTPGYMAPEQWTGQTVPQSDIYSLGVVLYELIAGRRPYTADTPAGVLLKQVNEPLPRPSQFVPKLPEAMEKTLYKALAPNLKNRFQSMSEFSAVLEYLVSGNWASKTAQVKAAPTNNVDFTLSRVGQAAVAPLENQRPAKENLQPPKKSKKDPLASILAQPSRFLVVFGILTIIFVFIIIFGINWYFTTTTASFTLPTTTTALVIETSPFANTQAPVLYGTPTDTTTPIPPLSTWTPAITILSTITRTKAPTWTLLPEMVTPTVTTTIGMPAIAQIAYDSSTTIHADSGCTWLGVGGKVLDAVDKPLPFQTIQLGGILDGQAVSKLTLSGGAKAYGDSGYEFVLSDHPIASTQTLWIQLFDNTGKPLTDKIYFDTFTACDKNLALIVFKRSR